MQYYHTFYPSPVGMLTLVAYDEALLALLWEHQVTDLSNYLYSKARSKHPILQEATQQLEEYFAGTRTQCDVPLAPKGTPFQLEAWLTLMRIPYGQTRSYTEQAQAMNKPNGARAVGAANRCNPLSIFIPCHRVIGANGTLTGFGGGIGTKKFLLELERQ